MLDLDRLADLIDELRHAPTQVGLLRNYLASIYDSPSYQAWLNDDQYLGYRSVRGIPVEPREAAAAAPAMKHLLDRHRLSAGGRLKVKVDRHGDRTHITDGFFTPPNKRVFPTTDESILVCDYIRHHLAIQPDAILIDPACGCGHHALALADLFKFRVSLDVSSRALAFARFNALLNGDTGHAIGYGDVRDGIPIEFQPSPRQSTVFAVNMPFAIDPKIGGNQPATLLAQDGGDRGIVLTLAALRAVNDYRSRNSTSPVEAVVLCYTLGKEVAPGRYQWEIEAQAEAIMPSATRVFHLAKDEMLWRVNGRKSELNPMPVENLARKADCENTFSDHVRDEKRAGFQRLAAEYRAAGYSVLGYGILHVTY